MAATKTPKRSRSNKSVSKPRRRLQRAPGGQVRPSGAREAEAATEEAWNAVKEAVRSSKTQPATAARATGKAVRNVARSGARQTGVAADAIARAAEELLVSAMSEARAAANAAREAAVEVERSVSKALNAIDNALRMRARVGIKDATRKRARGRVNKVA